MRLALCTAFLLLAVAAPPALAQQPLAGPAGTSLNKVLVIGTDGTRWDLLEKAMKAGKAPNLARLRRSGFGRPTTLLYGPHTLTLSEVGWSSIASGVWEDKHGVDGSKLNKDPGQATKNGYLDFLTRIENSRPRLSTFLASDWDNIGLPLNGGPIFGTAMDANFAARVPAETIDNWNRGDIAVTAAATRYLRHGDPDAGFVYLGLVDETAHLAGSATPTYANAIATTDARIGRLLKAIRARPTYPFESWTILVVTDHGQRPLSEPSPISHFGKTKLELTSFLFGSGPGLGRNVKKPLVVDILPTVLHQLGLATPRSWRIDGHTLSKARPPSSATAKLRNGRLIAKLSLGSRPRVRRVSFHLPTKVKGNLAVHANGRPAAWVVEGRTVTISLPPGGLRTISLTAHLRGNGGRSLVVTMRNGKLAIPL
jgi:predicted AlkP superfamily pyrophosphatase or phosphodiesterase